MSTKKIIIISSVTAVILCILAALYTGLSVYYADRFSYGTWNNGIYCTGKSVPEAAELCGRLRAAGLQLPDDLFTQEELHDHLLRLWKAKQEREAVL